MDILRGTDGDHVVPDHMLDYHLNYNHYPPLGASAIRLARLVLDHYRECEDHYANGGNGCFHTTNALPEVWVEGTPELGQVMDDWHLWDFLPQHDVEAE